MAGLMIVCVVYCRQERKLCAFCSVVGGKIVTCKTLVRESAGYAILLTAEDIKFRVFYSQQ